MNQNEKEVEIDLKELFYLIRRHLLLIILVAVLAGTLAGLYSKFVLQPEYSSSSLLFVLEKSKISSLADIQLGSSLTNDYMQLIRSRPLVEDVIESQKLDETYSSLVGKLSVSNPMNTRFLRITVRYDNPEMAKAIVDEFAEVAKASIMEVMGMQEPTIVQYGYADGGPVAPNTRRNCLIAIILAVALTCGIIIILYVLNDSMRSSEDVEKYLQVNVLSSIPIIEVEKN